MNDVSRCLGDGYSTGGTAGTGLGAVKRLSVEFDIHSVPGEGTVVMSRVGATAGSKFGAISIPVKGEVECGDGWAIAQDEKAITVMVVDGLATAAWRRPRRNARRVYSPSARRRAPRTVLERMHHALQSTRGAAAAIAQVGANGAASYAGIGNITGYLIGTEKSQGLVSHNGTLGLVMNRLQQFEYARGADSLLVMHSDGALGPLGTCARTCRCASGIRRSSPRCSIATTRAPTMTPPLWC